MGYRGGGGVKRGGGEVGKEGGVDKGGVGKRGEGGEQEGYNLLFLRLLLGDRNTHFVLCQGWKPPDIDSVVGGGGEENLTLFISMRGV